MKPSKNMVAGGAPSHLGLYILDDLSRLGPEADRLIIHMVALFGVLFILLSPFSFLDGKELLA